jgi:predicted dehydrogenase
MALHRVLIVGTGSIGERHLRCFTASGRADVSLCEVDDERRRAVADRHGVSRSFGDLPAALEDGCDAAVIATPAPLHVTIATQLADAGTHLLIEKPLSTNFDGIARLEQTVAARGIVAAVAYVYRAHPALQAMRQAIRDGRFGRPVQIVAVAGQHFPTYRPAYRSIYYNDRAQGGGAIQDALTHLLNAGEFLVGPIDRVMADAAHQVLDGVEVEDTVQVLARHGSVLGCYCLNQHQAPNEMTITVIGDCGTARFEMHNSRWRWMTEPDGKWLYDTECPRERDAGDIPYAHAFLDAVEGKTPPLCSLADGIQTLRVNLAVLAASDRPAWNVIQREDSTA